jgi:NADPH:quinone reductase-like Zn-dependent oxidoreductase
MKIKTQRFCSTLSFIIATSHADRVYVAPVAFCLRVLGGVSEPLNVLPLLMNEVRMQGVFVGPRESLEAMCGHIEAHGIRPVLGGHYAFGDAPAAFARMASGDQFGKVVITGE